MQAPDLLTYLTIIGGLFVIWVIVVALFAPRIDYQLRTRLACSSREFLYALQTTCQATLHRNNRFEILTNASQFYPAMLAAIRGAQRTVNMECYIFRPDETGRQFMDAVSERARTGVVVTIVVDAIGSFRFGFTAIRELRRAGCRVELYQRFKWYRLARINNRTHREILIVDGCLAFVGGAGIGDAWGKGSKDAPAWRDTMARVEGPVVAAIQGVFAENWLECCGEVLLGDEYFPPLQDAGKSLAVVVKSSPSDRATASRVVFQMLIEGALETVRLSTPYFLPDKSLRKVFVQTAQRGIKIELILPGPITDQRWVRLASRRKYGQLLRAGIRIYEYRPRMTHVKTLMVDDLWAVIGTTNFDNRSFEHNDEINVAVHDEAIACRLAADFQRDKEQSEEITLEAWRRRPLPQKLIEPVAWILERQQ